MSYHWPLGSIFSDYHWNRWDNLSYEDKQAIEDKYSSNITKKANVEQRKGRYGERN